jgi:proliferating cell nuclear antigen
MPKQFNINYNSSNLGKSEPYDFDKHFTKKTQGFRTKNSSYFKAIVSFMSNVIDNANFHLTKEGIKIKSMDKAHISVLDCFIPAAFFSNYSFCDSNERDITLGLDISILMKILNHLSHNDDLIFSYNTDSLDISFINKKYQKFYSIKLMDIDSDELYIPDCHTITGINIESKYFQEIIRDFTDIGETVRFIVSKERKNADENQNIELECTGDMTGLRMILCNDDLTLSNLQDISLEFCLKNLELFAKGSNLNKYVNLEIDSNYPLKMSYQIMDIGYINYFLAPRIEEAF